MMRRPPRSTLFPTRRSSDLASRVPGRDPRRSHCLLPGSDGADRGVGGGSADRKSTRLNSSHTVISYAVFCLKKKKKYERQDGVSPDTSRETDSRGMVQVRDV